MEIELKITDEDDSNNNRRGSAFDGHVRMEDINKVKNNKVNKLYVQITVPTHNKHSFVRAKKVCSFWEMCLIWENVLIWGRGGIFQK